jgi:hypothetical protein
MRRAASSASFGSNVRVRAEGQADLRVAEHLHRHPGGHALLQQQRRRGVPGIVQTGLGTFASSRSARHARWSLRGSIGRPFS